MAHPAKRTAYLIAGHAFVGLGVVGAILPLVPTTVFLLLAGACYARSSPRFHDWLFHNAFFGSYLRNYKDKRGTPLSIKIASLVLLWGTIGYTIYSVSAPMYVPAVLLLIAIGVTIHLLTIPTLKK